MSYFIRSIESSHLVAAVVGYVGYLW